MSLIIVPLCERTRETYAPILGALAARSSQAPTHLVLNRYSAFRNDHIEPLNGADQARIPDFDALVDAFGGWSMTFSAVKLADLVGKESPLYPVGAGWLHALSVGAIVMPGFSRERGIGTERRAVQSMD